MIRLLWVIPAMGIWLGLVLEIAMRMINSDCYGPSDHD